MKRTSIFLLSAFSTIALQAQETYLNESFESGIPTDFTNIDYDELPVKTGFNIPVTSDWFSQTVYGNFGKSAVSTSRNDFDLPASNWLITPQLTIKSSEAILAWDAKSIHYDLRDGYKIMVSTTNNNPESFTELYRVEAESYTWKHHLISLSKFAGKKVYLAILHDSQNKFLLAIDNLFVGVPATPAFDVKNDTQHFCGNTGTTKVAGKIRNIGKGTQLTQIVCTSGIHVLTEDIDNQEMPSGAQQEFSFNLPVTLNTKVPYQIDVVTAEGKTYRVLEDNIVCSYYPRTLLVEKGTGVWCTACPGLMGYMNELKEEYQDEVVLIESHSTYQDHAKLSFAPYDQGMGTANYPVIYFNRNQKIKAYDKKAATEALELTLNEETPAIVNGKAFLKGGKIAVSAEMEFGKELDNEKDKYRIGFAILQKHLQLPFAIQKSAVKGPSFQEFGFFSSPFSKDLMFFHNVVEGTDNAFIGIPNSLPNIIESAKKYHYDGELEIPSEMTNIEGFTVVAFIMDYFNNKILNTSEFCISDETTGIKDVSDSSMDVILKVEKNHLHVSLPQDADYRIEVNDMNGHCILKEQSRNQNITLSTNSWIKGTYIVTLSQNGKRCARKILIE